MTKKTISQLDDGIALQEAGALVAFEQNGATFHGRVRPNPTQQINVINEQQLIDALGANLEIMGSVTIVIDGSFTLNTSLKIAAGGSLDLRFSTIGPTLTWAGSGAMIENLSGEAAFFISQSVNVLGDGTNSFIDLTMDAFIGFTAIRSLNVDNLVSIGTIKSPTVFLASLTGFGLDDGIVFDNCARVTISNVVLGNFTGTEPAHTWLTFLNDVTAGIIKIDDATAFNSANGGDSFVFIDTNSVAGTSVVVTSSAITDNVGPGIFYELGTTIIINEVTNNGGMAVYHTDGPPHNMSVGDVVNTSGFSEPTYNNSRAIVTVINTGSTFETGVAFVTDVTGTMNSTFSLNQTDIVVRARDNTASPDSKNIGSAVVNGNAVVTTIISQGAFVDLNLGGLAVAGSNIERWVVTDTTTGELQYIGIEDFNGVLNAVIVLQPNSTDVFDIQMLVNGAVTPDAVSSRNSTSQSGVTPVASIPFNSPLSVVTGDLVRLQVANEDGTGNPTITDLSLGAQNP